MDDEREVILGTIEIRYFLDSEGDSHTGVSYPDFSDVPAIIQAGMLAYAQHALLSGNTRGEGDD